MFAEGTVLRLRGRLQRLEQRTSTPGRCAVCRDRAPVVLVSIPAALIPDNGRDGIVPSAFADVGAPTDDTTPCPICGWQPNVIKIHKVVVYSAEHKDRTLAGTAQ
jgi:hypothetical protein